MITSEITQKQCFDKASSNEVVKIEMINGQQVHYGFAILSPVDFNKSGAVFEIGYKWESTYYQSLANIKTKNGTFINYPEQLNKKLAYEAVVVGKHAQTEENFQKFRQTQLKATVKEAMRLTSSVNDLEFHNDIEWVLLYAGETHIYQREKDSEKALYFITGDMDSEGNNLEDLERELFDLFLRMNLDQTIRCIHPECHNTINVFNNAKDNWIPLLLKGNTNILSFACPEHKKYGKYLEAKTKMLSEYISLEEENKYEAWVCICNNVASSHGFYPCDYEGNEMEPDIDSNWDSLYVCARCGRIIDQITLKVVGQNPNPKFLE